MRMVFLNTHLKCIQKRAIIYEPKTDDAVPARGAGTVKRTAYEILKEGKATNI